MKVAVLADIHGNYVAMERCLTYACSQQVDTYIFLGDYIGELAYPERTMQLLYDWKDKYICYFIRGNKEDYWLNYRAKGEQGWEDNNSASGSLFYAYQFLTSRDLDFFEQLLPARELIIGDMPPITICHGSPEKINGKMLQGDAKTIEILNRVRTSTILCGHTHIQNKIEHKGKCVLNPGAVGVPLFSNGKTQFLILHDNGGIWSEEFISLSYDVNRVVKEMHEAKLHKHAPYWSRITEQILRGGNVSHGNVLSRAMALCKRENGNCVWPQIPEKYWKQAVDEVLNERRKKYDYYI